MRTVEVVHPGRFVIVQTIIDDPDVMKVELKALETAREFCAKPPGEYSPPPDAISAGPAERPTKITVTNGASGKLVMWPLPYVRWGSHRMAATRCTKAHYEVARSNILNGVRIKRLFDCKRALWGTFVDVADPPEEAVMAPVYEDIRVSLEYDSLCRKVNGEAPHAPLKPEQNSRAKQ